MAAKPNMTIVLATRNQGKLKEFQEILKNFPVEIKSLQDFGPIPGRHSRQRFLASRPLPMIQALLSKPLMAHPAFIRPVMPVKMPLTRTISKNS